VLTVGVILPPVFERLLFGSDAARSDQAQLELQALAKDLLANNAAQPQLYKRNVHKRLFTATEDGYLRFDGSSAFLEGRPERRDRRGYFLDPWNNPYWINHGKRGHEVLLYSFGANRRRDGESDRPAGDDVAVRLILPEEHPR
jgi:hypothetical protein